MIDNLTQHWKKEYVLLIAALLCLVLYYYRHHLKDKKFSEITEYLPLVGGLAFGLNTLIAVTK